MFDLDYNSLFELISFWGYPLMFLLMIIEGPVATMTAGFLSSLGLFNWVTVLFLSIVGDMIGDIILYFIGYFRGSKALETFRKILRLKQGVVEDLENNFEKYGPRIIFSAKTTTGLGWITFALAGAVKMPFKKFLFFSFLGGVFWSGLLVGLGYFFGYAAEQIERYIKFAGWGIFLSAFAIILHFLTARKKRTGKFITNTKKFGEKPISSDKKKISSGKNKKID